MSHVDQIKLLLAKAVVEGAALADILEQGSDNFRANDAILDFREQELDKLMSLNAGAEDFHEAFSYYGPLCTLRMVVQFAGNQKLYNFTALHGALLKMVFPEKSFAEVDALIKELPLPYFRNPQGIIHDPVDGFIRSIAVKENVRLTDIPDTGDALYFSLGLSDTCRYLKPVFMKPFFDDALTALEQNPAAERNARQAHLAVALAFACRRLPHGTQASLGETAYGPLSEQIGKAIDFYTGTCASDTVGDLSKILARMEKLSGLKPMMDNPEDFAYGIYNTNLKEKILDMIFKDQRCVDMHADSVLNYRLS